MTTYQGHRNRNYWNVALWLANDEPTYRRAVELLKRDGIERAARALFNELPPKTPDGVAYTLPTIRAALSGLRESL